MISLLVTFAIIVIVIVVVWYLLQQLPLPDPAQKIIQIALVIVVAIVVIWLLMGLGGQASFPHLR